MNITARLLHATALPQGADKGDLLLTPMLLLLQAGFGLAPLGLLRGTLWAGVHLSPCPSVIDNGEHGPEQVSPHLIIPFF